MIVHLKSTLKLGVLYCDLLNLTLPSSEKLDLEFPKET